MRILHSMALAGCIGLAALPARADPPEPKEATAEELAAARELWGAGLELEKKQDWPAALEKFGKVAEVRMTPQVRYHIAFCHEHLGHLVDALNGYEVALQEARPLGDKGREVLDNAPPRITDLKGRVAKLRLRVTGKLRTSILTIDGKKITAALLDNDIPVDPGKHVLEARRDGKLVQRKVAVLSEGEAASFTLEVDDPEPKPPKAKPPPSKPPPPAPSRVPAYITAGAGAALLIGAGVFFGLRQATISAIRDSCDANDNNCDPTLIDNEELGRQYTITSGVMLGTGLAALGAGVTLFFVLAPPKAQPDAPRAAAVPSFGIAPMPGGARFIGEF